MCISKGKIFQPVFKDDPGEPGAKRDELENMSG
jgi:hypothetical protein